MTTCCANWGCKAGHSLSISVIPKVLWIRICQWKAHGVGGKQGVRLEHIQPGKPQQNGYIERYNRTVRGAWLSQYIFQKIEEAQDQATVWLWTCNNA